MPNHCYIDFDVSGPAEDLLRFAFVVRGSDDTRKTQFDFNRLIPIPSELFETISDESAYKVYYDDPRPMLEYRYFKDLGIETVQQLREYFDADPQHRATADKWKANIEKYGAPTWREWIWEHWYTDRNACAAEVTYNRDGSLRVTFGTGWSFPLPIFEKLAVDFPTLVFEGSASEPNCELYIKFEGRNGEFAFEDDEKARAEAAAAYEEEDESVEVTA